MEVFQVFVSSTFDLQDERKAIEEELRGFPYKVFLYENEPAFPISAKAHCLSSIDQSRLVVLLVGPRYGSVVPVTKPNSVTEWEFEIARSQPRCLPIFGFIRTDAFDSADGSQRRFIARIQDFGGGVSSDRFRTTKELQRKVGRALHRWNLDFRLAREGPRRRTADSITNWVTRGMFLVVLVFVIALARWEVDRTVLATVCVLLITALLGGFALVEYGKRSH
jgi:hypothetical protein